MIDTCDYMGVNYYSPTRVAFDPTRPGELFTRQSYAPDAELSDLTPTGEAYGEIEPHGLYLALMQAAAYGKPIYITENGVPDHDDDVRPRFLATHLAETARAIADGADVRGFYHWTLVDNFEWAAAWSLRFGLFELDPDDQVRTPRTSAAVYSRMARRQRRAGQPAGEGRAGVWLVTRSWKLEAGDEKLWRAARVSTPARAGTPVSSFQLPVCPFHPGYAILRVVGPVAQLAEQRPFKPRVLGSIPNGLTLPDSVGAWFWLRVSLLPLWGKQKRPRSPLVGIAEP